MSAVKTHHQNAVAALAIRWTTPDSAWPSRPVLEVAVEVLPTIEDDIVAALIEQLALAIADLADELRSVRAVLREALAIVHSQHREIVRLRRAYYLAIADLRVLRQREVAG